MESQQSIPLCNCKDDNYTCTSLSSKYIDVSLPINLIPYATVNNIKTQCCGEPTISFRPRQMSDCKCGCEIVITQTLCITIPVEYNTAADVGNTTVNCKTSHN